ncbi:hypothetical protein [Acetivibrio cellulolyticus]|uniref:hypothetical protein n=1 Tax=Acetivibrio cellulolyticus TaxID=35830 RepID=UPI0001E2D1A7|nr:hypothetical protein [Acetivibrio cellulolyticus]
MRLIGSLREDEIRKQMIKAHNDLFYERKNEKLLKILTELFPDIKTAYFLGHTIEQCEDIYTLLVNDNIIVSIEIDKYNISVDPIVEIESVEDYLNGIGKQRHIEFLVAMDLVKKDLKSSKSITI